MTATPLSASPLSGVSPVRLSLLRNLTSPRRGEIKKYRICGQMPAEFDSPLVGRNNIGRGVSPCT